MYVYGVFVCTVLLSICEANTVPLFLGQKWHPFQKKYLFTLALLIYLDEDTGYT